MKTEKKIKFILGAISSFLLIALFVLWTYLVSFVDVQEIGPCGSSVGLATVNRYVHELTGVNFMLYSVTDWLGLIPIAVCLCFALMGLVQLIRRRSLFKVDRSILLLGVFYAVVIAVYVLFEYIVVNYRPVLISGCLEVSYPSSTTLLTLCVMPTAWLQLKERIKKVWLWRCTSVIIIAFTMFMVAGRLISGVHWFSDIVGGAILSAGLVMGYYAANDAL